jgi:hypothetical protein
MRTAANGTEEANLGSAIILHPHSISDLYYTFSFTIYDDRRRRALHDTTRSTTDGKPTSPNMTSCHASCAASAEPVKVAHHAELAKHELSD